jgi:hypothetical protein
MNTKLVSFVLPAQPVPVDTQPAGTFGDVLRLLSAYTYTQLQAEHAMVILKGQTA